MAKVVEPSKVDRVEIKTMTPELVKYHSKHAYEAEDPNALNEFQHTMHS